MPFKPKTEHTTTVQVNGRVGTVCAQQHDFRQWKAHRRRCVLEVCFEDGKKQQVHIQAIQEITSAFIPGRDKRGRKRQHALHEAAEPTVTNDLTRTATNQDAAGATEVQVQPAR